MAIKAGASARSKAKEESPANYVWQRRRSRVQGQGNSPINLERKEIWPRGEEPSIGEGVEYFRETVTAIGGFVLEDFDQVKKAERQPGGARSYGGDKSVENLGGAPSRLPWYALAR